MANALTQAKYLFGHFAPYMVDEGLRFAAGM
jgi:hypothetical protein